MGGGVGDAANEGRESSSKHPAASVGRGGDDAAEVTVNVRCSNGSKFSVKVVLDSTVESFKSVVAQSCDIPAQQQKLIYKGRILKDDQTLQSYGLESDHTLHLVRGFVQGVTIHPTSATTNSNPNPVRDTASNEGGLFGQAGFGASLFPGLGLNELGTAEGLIGSELPDELEQMQQQMAQNPNLMRDILNMPFVQNMLNSPDVIRNMIMNNPQTRELIDRNPELAHVLNDPGVLRQTMDAARNPELMRELMRNTDRAMSNIESSPEGFNMLRRMYENVQEPLLNATTTIGDTRNNLGSNPFATLLSGQRQGLDRDQSSNPVATNVEITSTSPSPNSNPLPNPWVSGGARVAQTNTNSRSNTAADARPSPAGGLGSTDSGRMLNLMPDLNSISQLMQNPAMTEMMRSIFSNPQHMNQILGVNPQLWNIIDSNPQLQEMMQNPELLRQLTSPEAIQRLLNFQQVLSQLNPSRSNGGSGQDEETRVASNGTGMETLMNMFGALDIGGTTFPHRSNMLPEELYATQLSQLQDMGFLDAQENIRALVATSGNINAAVERLLGNQ